MISHIKQALPIMQNFSYIFVLRILQRVIGFVSLYFIVRALSQTDFGIYQFVLSVSVMLAPLALSGFHNVITQSTARGALGAFWRLGKLGFLASFSGVLALGCVAVYFLETGQGSTALGLCIVGLFFPMRQGLQQWKYVYTGQEKFKELSLFSGGLTILTHTSLIALALIGSENFLFYVLVTVGIEGLFNVIMSTYVYWQIRGQDTKDDLEEGSVEYGLKTSLYAGLNALASNIDKVLLFVFLSPATLAIFYAAERLSELVKNIVQDLAIVIAPRFARQEEYTAKLNKVIFWVSLVAGAGIIFAAFCLVPWFVVFLFGDEYVAAIPYAQALMCTVAVANGSVLKFQFITSRFDFKGAKVINYAMSFGRIAASLLLVPFFGIIGAIISVSISRLIVIISVEYIIRTGYLKELPS